MFYYNGTTDAIKTTLDQLETKMGGVSKHSERDACIDYYKYNGTEKYIAKYFKGSLQKEIPLYTQNFSQRLINRISMVYKNAPIRTVENDSYVDFINSKDYQLKKIERLHNLLGTIAVKICPDYDGLMQYMPVVKFVAFCDDIDTITPTAIAYKIGDDPSDSSNNRYVFWSKDEHFIFDSNGAVHNPTEDNVDMVNPYGVLPFVFLQPSTQVDEFWNDGAKDIVTANRQIDIAMTMLQHHIRSAGGQFVIQGRVDSNQIELGLNKAVIIEEGSMTNLNPNIDINSIVDGIKFQLQHIFQNHHVTFDYGINGSKSGVSLKIENLELIESREDDVEKYRIAEREIYAIEVAIAEALGSPINSDFSIDFAEVEFPLTPEQEQARWDWLFANGLKDKVDYLMESDPDGFPSREDAEEYLSVRGGSANKVKNMSDTEDNAFKLNSGVSADAIQ
jgi:hypothetical protein